MIGEKVRRERRWTIAGATPARKVSMAIGFETEKVPLDLKPDPALGLTSGANPVLLPEPKPRAMREHFVVPSIRSREVAGAEWPNIRRFDHFL